MKNIILSKLANQSFEFRIGNDQYKVTLNSRNKMTYLSYSINGIPKLLNRICLNKVVIDDLFMFEDTQGQSNPYFNRFNGRFKLILLYQ